MAKSFLTNYCELFREREYCCCQIEWLDKSSQPRAGYLPYELSWFPESTENMLCLNRTEPTGHPTHQSLSATRSLPQHIIGQNNGVDGFSGHLMDNGTMSVVDLNRLISRPNPVSLHVLKMSPPSVGENQNVSPHNTTRNPLLNGLASPGSLRPISRQVSGVYCTSIILDKKFLEVFEGFQVIFSLFTTVREIAGRLGNFGDRKAPRRFHDFRGIRKFWARQLAHREQCRFLHPRF